MDFSVFDKTEIENYVKEAKQKWRHTDAYKEYAQKHCDFSDNAEEFMQIFAEIGKLKHLAPHSSQVQALIKKLQSFITNHYYACTDEILTGLGQMYIADERFKNTIDKAGGVGTAEFTAKAIRQFVKN